MIDLIVYLYIIGALIGAFICVFIGRCLDLTFRQGLMRILTRRDLGILAIVDKTKRKTIHIPVDFSDSTLIVDKCLWIFNKRHLYVKEKKELGFYLKDDMLKFEEGVPILYVNRDSVMPVIFGENDDPVKPQEIYAGLKAWVDNERAKLMATANILKTLQMLLLILLVVEIIVGGAIYMVLQQIQKTQITIDAIAIYFGVNTNSTAPAPTPAGH